MSLFAFSLVLLIVVLLGVLIVKEPRKVGLAQQAS